MQRPEWLECGDMKISVVAVMLFFLGLAGTFSLHAQTNAPAGSPPAGLSAKEYALIAFLTPDEQQKYAAARAKALADNPALDAEGQELMQEAPTLLKDGTKADQVAFLEKMRDHRQKLRAAMLEEDGSLQPIFAEIDKHISEVRAKQLSPVENSSSGTNSPAQTAPANP